MKKKLNSVYVLFFTAVAGYFFLSYSGNPPNGHTGAPPTMNTCASSQGGCHSGGTGTGNISIAGMPSTITPSTLYPITVTVTRTNGVPQLAGFQLVVQDASNSNSGILDNPGPGSDVEFAGGKYWFEHSPAQPYTGDMATFTAFWTSPASGSGNITMYAAGNLANGNGNNSGDAIVTTTAVGSFSGGPGPITVNVSGTNVSCFGGNNGTATASGSGGGGGPYTYNWSNGGSGPMIINLTTGTYTVSVTNGAGGSGTGSITITQPPQLTVTIVNQTNVTCAVPLGSATAQGSGGTGTLTYSWSTGASGPTASLPAGTHTVSVTDANSCVATTSVTILSNTTPPTAEAGPTAQITCTTPTPTLNGTGSSTGGNFTYNWTTVNGVILSGATTLMPVVAAAGTYTLTVTNLNNGCTASDATTVTNNLTAPTSNAGADMGLTCTITSLLLNGSSSSSGPNFTYLWTTTDGHIVSGATTLMPTVDEPGTYCLKVTNTTNGCTATDCAGVTENVTPPVSNAGTDGVLTCANTSIQLNGSSSSSGPNFTYLWTTADGNIVSGATTPMPTVDEPGTYCLKVTNTTNGCTATDCAGVTENVTPPLANAGSAPPLTCTTTSVTLNGSASSQGPNFTYLWTTVNGNIVSGATTTMPVVNVAAVYTLTVTNATNGCTASSSVTVTSNTTPPAADAGPGMALNCNNTSVVLDGSGSSQGPNFTYLWNGPGIQSGGDTPNPTVNEAGTYTILVTNTGNGCTGTDNTIVTQTPVLNATISPFQNVTCNGGNDGSATAVGSGGTGPYSFSWSNGGNTAQINNLSAGTYTLTLTDEDDCTATASVDITQPPILNANASATGETSVGAGDGTATANPSGGVPGYTYAWSNGETTQTITGLTAGNYTVVVTDANGCTSAQTVTVTSFNCVGFGVSMASTNPSCNGSSDGTATATVAGGTGPYTFLWSNGQTTATATGLAAGSYTVSATDDNGCEATGNVTLTAPAALNLTVQQTNVACHGEATGTASVDVTGGTAGYDFDWSNGASGASQTDLAAGSYTVSVTDANGCTASVQVNISEPPALTGNVTAAGESAVGANDGTATAAMSGGVAPYSFEWSNGATTSTINGLAPGQYCASVTDANGCTFTGCATVAQFGCVGISTSISGENVTCFGSNDGAAQLTVSGFSDPLTVEWSNGATGTSVGSLTAGVYSVSVTDANSCTAVDETEITQPTELAVEFLTQTNVDCPGTNTGSISVDGSGGTPGYAFSWSNGATTPTIGNLAAGTYEVSISDENDCTASMGFEIEVLPDNEAPVALAANLTVTLDATGSATITPAMVDGGSTDNCGIASMTLDVSDFTCADVGENTVTLTVQDAAGNTSTATATVTVVSNLSAIIAQMPAVCHGEATGSATALPTGGTPPYSYQWDDPASQTTQTAVNLAAGTYSVLVTDAAGCTTTEMALITEPATALTINVDDVTHTIAGQPDGAISVTAGGGAGGYSYQWFYNGAFFSDQEDISDLLDGEYVLQVTDQAGCVTEVTVEVLGEDATVEKELERNITLAPNPTSGRLFLRFDLSQPAAVRYQVFDLTGRPALPEQSGTSAKTTELDLAGIAPGVYLLRVIVGEAVVVKRFVVGR
ncbi:MAG: T9SS type A sorting domain-containing protein [Bacteroidetes bacterium]|nr:T9SS type A sorting domain-containing protein [Bacteroidota bacterium]